ncbi:MAG: 4Fe-4S dicluster domain-containing protein, partial [Cyclobacteriaceae bacterium]|nr:4Fe-4S dicluster domain-containing protein [Cyclobacteriaceae bacterium]
MGKNKKNQSFRRKFFKTILTGGIGAVAGKKLLSSFPTKDENVSDEKITALSPDGKLIKVLKSQVEHAHHKPASPSEARKGIPGKKFVLIVDLAKCKNARKCISSCEKHHHLTPDRPFIKVLKMQDNPKASP